MLRDSDGSEVRLFPPMRGRPTQLFAADDYLVRAYPYQFRLSDRARSGGARSGAIRVSAVADRPTARSAITSPDPGLGLEPWRLGARCEGGRVSEKRSPVSVRLPADTRASIVHMVEETTGRDGLEIGSLILGRSRSTVVELLLACRPGGVPVRGEAFFRSDPDYETDILRRVAPMGVDAVAYWHAHPRGHRDLSKQDLQAGMWKRSAAGVSCFVEVLVVPSGASWELECWTIRRDDSGPGDVAERALLAY